MNDIEILEDMHKTIYMTEKQHKAIKNLINRVKELEEIEKEHQKQNGELQEKIEELYEDNRHQWEERCKMAIELDNDVIPKSKIKEKIEELEKDEEFYREQDRIYEFEGKINILKQLLEEQEDK